MTEPDVTLTDYVVCAECAVFAWLIARQPTDLVELRRWAVLFFVFTALAALFGGTVHGFYADVNGGIGRVLWKISMLAIGATALAGWAIGAHLLFGDVRRDVLAIAAILTVAYAVVIVFVTDAFWVAVAGYLPAAAFLFLAFLRAAVRGQTAWAGLGTGALALSFAAAAIQQLRIALHPVYFNHNALYHFVQAVALALLFIAFRNVLASTAGLH